MHLHIEIPAMNDGRSVKGLMWGLSIFTMTMTVPQILTIWLDRQATGVSTISWSAYLAAAVVWLWYGLRKRDVNIYLPCIGWIVLDSAVVIGALLYR